MNVCAGKMGNTTNLSLSTTASWARARAPGFGFPTWIYRSMRRGFGYFRARSYNQSEGRYAYSIESAMEAMEMGNSTASCTTGGRGNSQYTTHHTTAAERTLLIMDEGAAVSTSSTAPAEGGQLVGCRHYKRRSKFVTPCCNKVYTCRFCHDENESHPVNRKDVTELVCTNCETRQAVQAECENCNLPFGTYTCLKCKLFDDEDKKQYHCEGCGICRIGGRDKFFHCKKCNMCLPVKLVDNHKCVENVSRSNCPVCLEDIHTSRMPCHIPDCGHLLHRNCYEDLLTAGHYACPTCQTSLLDMSELWKFFDKEIQNTPMPAEYKDYKVDILCKDCHKESTVAFHVVALKCAVCGSYNTCRIKGPPFCLEENQPQESSAAANNGAGTSSGSAEEQLRADESRPDSQL